MPPISTHQTRHLLAALATLFLATPAAAQTFTDETSFAGVGTTGNKDGGIAWADLNRDGCLDLFVNTDNSTERSRIYLSDCGAGTPGRPTFTDVTSTNIAGFLATTDERSAVVGDLTGDGYLDLLRNDSDVTQIYFNNGPGQGFTFGDGSQNPNISYDTSADWPDNRNHNTEGAGFIDYDGDGDLDVVLDNHNNGVVLLQNDGAGVLTFIDPTTVGLPFSNSGDGDYSTVADIDLDGDTDFLARKGTGANGLDIYTSMRVDLGTNTFEGNPNFNQDESNSNKGSIAVCDFNNDQRPDIFWTDNGTNQIWRNDGQDANGHAQFTALGEPSASSGVNVSGIDHASCGDVDNDGDLDLFLTDNGTDYLFINNGGFSFTRDNRGITGNSDGEGAAFADYDRDGDLDLIINQDGANELWRNTTDNENYMIIAPTLSRGGIETPAIGATIVVTDSNGVTVGVREISGGNGHGSSGAHDAHFGLPDPNERYTATIQYPNGATSQVCFTPSEQVGYHRAQVLDTAPSTCAAEVCGDGFKTLDEKCDDGNTTDGDGCSAACEIETGWQCMERGSFSRLQGVEDDLPSLSTDWYVDADATTIMERSDNHGFYPVAAEHRGQVYTVDVTPRDNDSFGVAFGYRPGEIGAASDVDFYLFTWCQVDCGDFGTGARLIRIDQPGMTAADYLAQAGFAGATQVATGTNFPNTGFVQGQTYRLEFGVSGSRVQLSIDGASEIDYDTGATFDEGFALFSYDMNSSPFVNATAQTDTSLCYAPNCRDGNIDVGEQCDDGNDISGDGCSSCLIDAGAACGNDPASASSCVNIEVPTDGSTIMTEGTYSGSASPGASVTLTWRNTIGLIVASTTVTADANGDWSAPPQGLLDGEYDLTASVSTGIGTAEDTHTFTLNSGNTSVTLIEPADNSRTDDNTPTFSGTGEAGDTITIIVDGNNIGTTTVTPAGTWSFTPTTPIAEGNHTVSVEAENLFGNTAMDGPHAFEIDLDFDDDGLTNDEERALNTDINNPDTDGDGVRDDVEVGPDVNNPRDTDMDNTIDALDTDDDGDGILTEDEDLDGDGDPTNDNSDAASGDTLPNYLDNDDDNDGVLTLDEDIDGDGDARNDNTDAATGDILPDYLDTDDDGDSTLTINEPGDADNSGTPDRLEPCTPDADSLACPSGDPDGDGTPNDTDPDPLDPCVPDPNALACDTGDTDGDTISNGDERNITGTDPTNPDTDGDGLRDDFEVGPDLNNPINTDMDALIDALDPDDDGDGVSTLDEDLDGDGDPTNDNTDAATGDTTPDYLDTDDDGDGTLTINEPGDADNSGTPDRLEPCTPDADSLACPSGDPDGDGTPNDMDPDPLDPCVPDPNALACDTGDTDGDTITNGDERNITGTDPNNPDTDGDGLRDDFEVGPDLNNPINTDMDALIDALDPDDDGDGVSTLDEDLDGDGDPTNDNTDAATGDTTPDYLDTDDDGDGKLTEDEDLNNNADYTDDDSDGDGIIEYLDPDDNDGPNGDADMDGITNINEDVDGDGDYTNDDTDMDNIPDYLDPDDDNDGVPTIEEDLDGVGDSRNDDSDGDTVPNYRDTDDDGDGVLTTDEDVDGDGDPTNDDSNMDNVPNFLDPCDPDDMATACSSGDTDNDGTPNDMDPDPTDPCIPNPNALACDTGDTDGDTISNGDERNITGTDPTNPDTDGDGLRDDFEIGPDLNTPINTDMDNLINALDADDDGDNIDTANEDINGDGDPTNDNRDGDGLPNYLDPDDDNDGVLTRDEDNDGDGDPSNDFTDGDALPDYLDTDDDNDGILTENEPGDTDNSGTPDRLEVCAPDPNVAACGSGDMDGDGTPNDMDPDPADPCVPDPNALTCDSGDTDGDTITNGDERTAGTDPTNPDTDGDGVRDDVEVGPDVNNPRDTDMDNTIDALDTDDDGDGILTEDEDLDGDGDPTNDDSDTDTIPDYLDPDDDNDGIDTIDEDLNMNGDSRDDDSDTDNIPDYLDPDDDNDGVLTIDEDRDGDGDARNDNTDGILGDTTPDYLDVDDDGDGVLTALEDLNMNGDFFDDDTNMDNVPNFLDPCDPNPLSQACAEGDTDGDEVPNNMDPDPLDPCVPNADALACPTGDTDMDGIPNQVERTIGTDPTLLDSDFDGIPDGVEVGNDVNNPIDTDMDMIIDALDPDDDGDGVPTVDEDIDGDGDPTNDDTDMDNIPDYLDPDDDNDGVLTIDEDIDGDGDPTNDDSDMDMIPNYLDTDDDGDGVLTVDEDLDMDGDPTNDDTDGDTVPNYLDTDDDGDSIPTRDEDLDQDGDASNDDSDGDMVPNYLDPDDDNDGVLTRFEDVDGDGDPTNDNTDAATGDTTPDYLDTDDDGDSILTQDEDADPNGDGDPSDALDSDMDGTPDYLDPDNGMMGTLAITAPLDGDVTTRTPTFAGTSDPGAEVEVFVDGESVGTTTADANGAWSLTVPDDESLAAGPHEVSATSDTGAMAGPVSFTVIDDMPSEVVDITSPENGATLTDATVTITGTATPNATVDVRVDGESIGTVMADDNGDWSIEATLEDGPHSIEAKNGAASDLINVEVAIGSGGDNLAVEITSPAMADEVLSPTPTFTGTATAGASVEVFVDDVSVGTTTADEDGNWSVTVADEDALEVGEHDVRAVATLDGESQESDTIPFIVSEDAIDDVELLLIGGCSQTPGAPAPFDMAPWLAALGLLALGRKRRAA